MKKLFICVIPVILLIAGCSSPIAGKHGVPLKGDDRKVVIKGAAPIADEILNGLSADDYEQFSAHFERDFLLYTPRGIFEKERERLKTKVGKYKSHKLANVYRHGPFKPAVYKVKFEKDTVTMKIVLTPRGDGFVVSGLSFESPKLKK